MSAPVSSTTNNPADFIAASIDALAASDLLTEVHGNSESAPYLSLTLAEPPDQDDQGDNSAGYLRLWRGQPGAPLDRMVYLHLVAGPVTTQLLFVFGRPENTMPHIHAQLVSFPPNGLVYNVDLIPRLDPIDHFEWFQKVYGPLRRPYRKATTTPENSCAQAPANPALAVLMSPWGIASQRTDAQEFERVESQLRDYVDHYLSLAQDPDWESADEAQQRHRDARHLALFFSDELDPRAWAGVYRIVGEPVGMQIKSLMTTPLN